MKTMLIAGLISLSSAAGVAAIVRADEWNGPKEVAQAAKEFADACQLLQKAIQDVDEASPLVEEVGFLSRSADQFRGAVEKGATYEAVLKDYRKIERDYDHFVALLKKAHDVHHDEQVVASNNKTKAAYDHLRTRMSGRHPSEKHDQARPGR